MAIIQNYIRINGEYVPQESIPAEQMKEISRSIITRLAAGFGYSPVETESDSTSKEGKQID